MKFRNKPIIVEAWQWFKNGDHPKDEVGPPTRATRKESDGKAVKPYRDGPKHGNSTCPECSKLMKVHGLIDDGRGGMTVCPGDWVITYGDNIYICCKPDIFLRAYEPIEE